jgi:hypothetical protein
MLNVSLSAKQSVMKRRHAGKSLILKGKLSATG